MEHIIEGARHKYAKLRMTDQKSFSSLPNNGFKLQSPPKFTQKSYSQRRISLAFNNNPGGSRTPSPSKASKAIVAEPKDFEQDGNHTSQLLEFEQRLDRKLREIRRALEVLKQPERTSKSAPKRKSRRVSKSQA